MRFGGFLFGYQRKFSRFLCPILGMLKAGLGLAQVNELSFKGSSKPCWHFGHSHPAQDILSATPDPARGQGTGDTCTGECGDTEGLHRAEPRL